MDTRVTIDISEPLGAYGDESTLPHPTVLTDDGDMVLSFGDVSLRMNYAQFDELAEGMVAWSNRVGGGPRLVLSKEPET